MPIMDERDRRFDEMAERMNCHFGNDIRVGGKCVLAIRDGALVYVSGQIPRVGDQVVVVGSAGDALGLDRARLAAGICALRALAVLRLELGSLAALSKVLRMTVFVHCDANFTLHSEVADGASEILHYVLGDAGRHARTAVGVQQLPKPQK